MAIVRDLVVSTMLAVAVLLSPPVNAQVSGATLSGTVTDTTDAILPGVTITALHVETGNTFVA